MTAPYIPASTRIPLPRQAAPTVFLASPDGTITVIDTVAVEQAVRGKRSGWNLTEAEIRYAAPFMFDLVPYSVICSRLGVSAKRLKELFPVVGPARESAARPGPRAKAPSPCGTHRGYRAHKNRREDACRPCKDANAAADRHYRQHGTYVSAPELAVAS